MKLVTAIALGMLFAASTVVAQVSAKPITENQAKNMEAKKKVPEGMTEMKSPMLLELKVPAADFTSATVAKMKQRSWATTATSKFVCDKAVVKSVELKDTIHRRGRATIEVKTQIGTTWFRQDINLTLALLAADGHEVGKKTWRHLTIGNDWGSLLVFGSHTKQPTLKIKMPQTDFIKLFGDNQDLTIRVVVDIVGDHERKGE